MQFRLWIILVTVLLISACQSSIETRVVMVVTATPDPNATVEVMVVTATLDASSAAATETVSATTTDAKTTIPPTSTTAQTSSSTATPSPTPSGLPTPVVTRIQVAEQLFEGGRMFWLQPAGEFWVMFVDPEVEGRGRWVIYADTFEEGVDAESDPSLVPPSGDLYQPVRGFGKLWRENEEVRDILGWGITPEFGFVSAYEYHLLTRNGELVLDPTGQPIGYHILFSLDQEAFRFNEFDSTWQLNTD